MKWWKRLGLRGRIFVPLAGLVLITLLGGAVMIWYTYRIESLFASVWQTNVAQLEAAEELETALLSQRGLVSYYALDHDPKWLQELEENRQAFQSRFEKTRALARTPTEQELLDRIGKEYDQYTRSKNRVIELYQAGETRAGTALHQEVRGQLAGILQLSEQYKDLHQKIIIQTWNRSRAEATRLRLTALSAMTAALSLGALLAFVLAAQILRPLRSLAKEADRGGHPVTAGDEMAELRHRVRGLIYDVDYTHTELERSRERLLQSEKMALLGKLAAEVAHSIRNPMTSIKMRLFSLERTLELSPTQREDFAVVAEQMRHLDNIVRNFLEFSRPPKLKMQKVDVSELVDGALKLLQNRFELLGLQIVHHPQFLPGIEADPELLKEVLVNLLVNACDAMGQAGRLTVTEEEAVAERMGRAVVVQVSDTGPGIPEALQQKVFEPFFSTKEDGTGLGLSIAQRIVEEHGGRLELRSREGQGATFIVTLPVREGSGAREETG